VPLVIVRREGEGIRVSCGGESIDIVVGKLTETRCTLDCIGPRSLKVERIETGACDDHRQAARGKDSRTRK
jgi:hypothetical protein